jgi:copper homeostasis protein (lipoprotein)
MNMLIRFFDGLLKSVKLAILFLSLIILQSVHAESRDNINDNSGRDSINITASYRERIALPQSAVFEAFLEDVSIADAKAELISQISISNFVSPPIHAVIGYDREKIIPEKVYAVRARILVDGKIKFTSDKIYPVITRGANKNVDLLLRMVQQNIINKDLNDSIENAEKFTVLPAHGLNLPATFRGDLPCADCEGIRYHLDLWPDLIFQLRRTWLGKGKIIDDLGRWRVDPERRALILEGGKEMPLQFEIKSPNKIRQLDLQGNPIESELPYDLISDGKLNMTELSLHLAGEMIYLADAGLFTECMTGRSYPINQEGDFLKIQKAYLESIQKPGDPLYVSFEGIIKENNSLESDKFDQSVTVQRFINVWPDEQCERAKADASLKNTYWRIVKLFSDPINISEGRREPHLLLTDKKGEYGYSATIGCNQLRGSYSLDGNNISFDEAAMTMMACPPPLDDLEKLLLKALKNINEWHILGNTLELKNEKGEAVALLKAVYF